MKNTKKSVEEKEDTDVDDDGDGVVQVDQETKSVFVAIACSNKKLGRLSFTTVSDPPLYFISFHSRFLLAPLFFMTGGKKK